MRRYSHSRYGNVLLVGLFAIVGCVNLDPPEHPARYYVLGPTVPLENLQHEPAPRADVRIGIRGAHLAEYLNTSLIVTRIGTHEVTFAEYHRWGENLGRGFARALATYLMSNPAVLRADVAPWRVGVGHDVILQINVERFEGEAFGTQTGSSPAVTYGYARMLATWEILDAADERLIHGGNTDFIQDKWAVGNHEQLVRLLDLGIQKLASDVMHVLDTSGK